MSVDIRRPLKKFLPHLLQAQRDNLNEADTVMRLVMFFQEVLGYDPLTEISREAQMKGKFVDVVLKIDGAVKLLVEAKQAGDKLRDRHIEQAESYASRNNYRWVLLTNGVQWNLYHLTFEDGIEYEKAFEVDLADETAFENSATCLALLHKLSIKKDDHEVFWQRKTALGPGTIGQALFSEGVLLLIRREIRRIEGLLIDPEDLANALRALLSPEAREQMGPLKIRKSKAKKKTPRPSAEQAPDALPLPTPQLAPADSDSESLP